MRKILWKAMCGFLLCWLVAPCRAVVPGDLDGNGQVDLQDVVVMLRLAIGLQAQTSARLLVGDVYPVSPTGVYGDGKIDLTDARTLLQRVVGILPAEGWPGNQSFNVPAPDTGVPLPTIIEGVSIESSGVRDFAPWAGYLFPGQLSGAMDLSQLGSDLPRGPDIEVSNRIELVNPAYPQRFPTIASFASTEGSFAILAPEDIYDVIYILHFAEDSRQQPPSPPWKYQITMEFPLGKLPLSATSTHLDYPRPAWPILYKVEGDVMLNPSDLPLAELGIIFNQVNDSSTLYQNTSANWDYRGQGNGSHYVVYLPAGTYRPDAQLFTRPGGIPLKGAAPAFTVTGNMTQNLKITPVALPGPATVGGIVTLAGTPVINEEVMAWLMDDYIAFPVVIPPFGFTSGNGTYTFPLRTGNYIIDARYIDPDAGGVWEYRVGPVNVQGNTVQNIDIPVLPSFVTLTGHIQGAPFPPPTSGNPQSAATVGFASTSLSGVPGLSYLTGTRLDVNGNYSIRLPRGTYRVQIDVPM